MVGQSISHYKIVSELGRGGMGIVYKAEDVNLSRPVALKVLPSKSVAGEFERARFFREARSAAALNHPNIATIYQVDVSDGAPFIAMEYVEGRSLEEHLRDGTLPLDEVVRIALEIGSALAAAHEAGIVHRDIKSANVMLTESLQAKVLDFGLAKGPDATTITQEGTRVGTIAYMSPEQSQGIDVDARSDLFSLGVLLYEMVTGQRPFQAAYEAAVIYSILNTDPEPIANLRPDAPEELEQIIGRLLEKNVDTRYQSAPELIRDLELLEGGHAGEILESAIGKRQGTRRRESLSAGLRLVLAGVGIATVVIIAFGVRRVLFPPATEASIDSIAVLPLTNMAGDADQEFFVDGMTQTLIGELQKIGALKVISRQSIMQFKGSTLSLPEIAQQLDVTGIVEGSVYRDGESVRISASLIDAETDQSIWSGDFDLALENIFALHSEVAQSIAEAIEISLTPAEEMLLTSERTVDPDAYEDYLKGQFYLDQLTPAALDNALILFESALEKDPDFALAHAGVAGVWSGRIQMGFSSPQEALFKASTAAESALALDSTLAYVHNRKAGILAWGEWDFRRGLYHFERAIELNPSFAEAKAFYGHLLATLGDADEGLEQVARAVELDPLNPLYKAMHGVVLMNVGSNDEAISRSNEVLSVIPGHPLALWALHWSYFKKGDYESAISHLREDYEIYSEHELVSALDQGYSAGGYKAAIIRAADTLSFRSLDQYVPPSRIVNLYYRAGSFDEAFAWAGRGIVARDPNIPYLGMTGIYSDLVDDPRYLDLLHRIGVRWEEDE